MHKGIKSHLLKILDAGRRLDGRANILEIRKPVKVEKGISNTAEGSSKVSIGDTEVLAGVKVEISEPYPDRPDEGTIMVGAELIPLSNPEFESGPPTIQAIELARVVDRGIRESKAVDFKKLCIKQAEKAWILLIDIVVLNDDGNLIDASALAVLAALQDMRFPEYDGEKIDYKKKTDNGLELNKEPIAVTVSKVGKHFIVDPTLSEEKVIDSRLTVTTTKDGTICALQKGGEYTISEDDVSRMIDIGIEKSKLLRQALG
ncbi:exosome complex protein Rrp42 [Candidatus Woesearchaeota archaeon]|nr:exosome complex protein Rrp42 [Candidatus Woesearchaeota archaeon]